MGSGDFNEAPDLCFDRFPPKYGTTTVNKIISDICSTLSLVDIHRFLHNDSSPSFTWFKPDLTQKSRIDFWLISDNLISSVKSCSISNAPLTDHAGIELEISDVNYNLFRKPGYWKLNSSLLNNSDYCLGIKGIIDYFTKNTNISHTLNWEMFKYECRKFSIKFSKDLLKSKGLQFAFILKEINRITCLANPNDAEKESLYLLREKLDSFYIEKAKGAFIRSRAKWLEAGEKNSAYFFNLEKKRAELKKKSSLYIDNTLISDDKIISKFVSDFYQKLYTSSFNPDSSDLFF